MAISGNNSKIQEFLQELGLDTSKARNVVIEIPAEGVVTINVDYVVTDKDTNTIKKFAKEYKLVEK